MASEASSTRRGHPRGYRHISDYALISDSHCVALVSREASIDWCCMPRVDSESVFARLLDARGGGYFAIDPLSRRAQFERAYVGDSMVLSTKVTDPGGEVEIMDLFTLRPGGRRRPQRQLVRMIRGLRGSMDLRLTLAPRFDYGLVQPWVRMLPGGIAWTAVGGQNGLLITCDRPLERHPVHILRADLTVRAGECVRTSLTWMPPEVLELPDLEIVGADEIDERVTLTLQMWHEWAAKARFSGPDAPGALRSAIVLKALTYAPTGAIVAAPTTSLPEWLGADRNYDYRFSWIRDSAFSVDTLAEIGCDAEADLFRQFIERSSAGDGRQLQIMYGVTGTRSIPERVLDHLEGYMGSRPVRVGNAAATQLQLDVYGHLLLLAWRWHLRGHAPDDDYWRFLVQLVDLAAERWQEPDRGIWEVRGAPRHFVHSKVMCWVALDRGVRLARESMRRAPIRRWTKTAQQIREAVESQGYDEKRGVFVQAFGTSEMDAALLLVPMVDFVDFNDPRMRRTVSAIREDLENEGFVARYRPGRTDDGFTSSEGVFLACSFWLAECLAQQGDFQAAREVFDHAAGTCNDVGLFAEEWDPATMHMLGNFPQALSHLAHLQAAIALNAGSGGNAVMGRPDGALSRATAP